MIVAAVIIAFIIIFAVGKAAGMFKNGTGTTQTETTTKVKVPDVRGMTVDEATTTLSKKKLGIKIAKQEASDTYEKGTIIRQDPEGDSKVDKNTEVRVVVSTGKEIKTVQVPDVSGKDENSAQKALEAKNLVVEFKSEYNDSVDEGKVISTDPAAGTEVKEGTTVTMIVSQGAEKATVPTLVGLSQEDADAALAAAGLVTGSVTEDYSDQYEAGIVMSQKTKENKKVNKGTTVDYVVSKGPKVEKVSVPGLGNMTYDMAMQALSDRGLVGNGTEEYSNVTVGYVVSQSAPEGTMLEKGSTVNFVISLGPKPSEVPENPDNGNGDGGNSDYTEGQ